MRTRLDALYAQYGWAAAVLYAALYVSDYCLTIRGAVLARASAAHYVVEGGYELTPYFRDDVARLRRLSPRFLLQLVLQPGFILVLWWVAGRDELYQVLFQFGAGALILQEAAIHVRHAGNLARFGMLSRGEGVVGSVTFSRRATLAASAAQLWGFCGLYLVCCLLTGSPALAGGAASCAALAASHQRLAAAEPAHAEGPPVGHEAPSEGVAAPAEPPAPGSAR